VFIGLALALGMACSVWAQNEGWAPVTGAETLRNFMSGLVAERKLPSGEVSRAEYKADGTGVLYSWGAEFPRTWEVKGDDQLCFTMQRKTRQPKTQCYTLERNTAVADLYRVREVATGIYYEFTVAKEHAVAAGPPSEMSSKGGAAAASAAEIAAELANPNTALGTLNTNFDYIKYDGTLAGADDESAFKVTFQPSLPYPLGGGTNFFVRPAIPIIFDQPVPVPGGGFESKGVELGDIGYDASFGFSFKQEGGTNVLIAGLAGAIPTATDDALGSDQWLLGPELGAAIVRKWGALGILASHQWDIAGEDSFSTSITSGQYFYTINLKDGWQISGGPPWSYNHKADSGDAWTFPLGIGIAKTAIWGGRPWKLSVQYWNFVEAPDAFGPEHQIRFTVGPVVSLPWKGRQ
jgi:hypothetical protein